jgi:hypothetical protein
MAGVLSKKTRQQFVGPFEVTEKIGRLAYRLKLPPTMAIHNVVSVVYLEPATAPDADPYGRYAMVPPPIVVDNEDEWEIEKLLRKRQRRFGRAKNATSQYLVRWKGCGPEDDKWMSIKQLQHAPSVIKEYKEAYGQLTSII